MSLIDPSEHPMSLAIEASASAFDGGNMPFGATLVSPSGEVLFVAENKQITTNDCTAHAELVLVREAATTLGKDSLVGATVFASGEPCAMCCGAMFWAGISKVVFAATTSDIGMALGGPSLPIESRAVLAGANPAILVEGPVMAGEAVSVLLRFKLRKQ